ncbi:MAG: hypothetical protein J6S21_08140 [Victivallales bacterium]|nr:hypothetical protein [Victivallales bacterium]
MHIFSLLLLPALILTSYASESLNPLEKFDQFVAQRRNIKQAEKHVSEGEYKKAAKSFRKAAKEQVTPEKTAEYYLREAESFLMAKKCSKAKEAYTALLEKHLFHIPLDRVLEQMRELADHFENGRGTFLGIDDPGAAIQIYETIIKYQPSVEESIEDRLVLAGKLAAYGSTAEAVNKYQELIKMVPSNPNPRFNLGKLLFSLIRTGDGDGQRSQAAVRELKSFLELAQENDPRRAEAEDLIYKARCREAERLLERAEFYLNKHHYRPAVARRYLHDIQREFHDTPAAAKAKEILALQIENAGDK